VMKKASGRGRRPGRSEVREQIRDAARARFLAGGYQAVTMRAIAADAGVDVALVSYYFGSKQGVFGAAMALPVNPSDAIAAVVADGDLEGLAPRLLRMALSIWDDPATGGPLLAIAGAVTGDPDMRRLVREFVGREVVGRIAERIGGDDASARAATFSAQMSGIVFSRYLLGVEPLASMSVDEIVQRLGPALQLALFPTHGA
jgi:AcrR family transcriptional regulator